ncbi:MAG: PKD domain-containing protein [Thermoplasmata archaeon]|nr:MAG: PKD domain-containing protein [Thermoplasmata archaeon]
MKSKVAALWMCSVAVLSAIVITVEISGPVRGATTIYVDDDGGADYTSIRTAVENATSGDIIIIYPGYYYEEFTQINMTLTLRGQTATGIDIECHSDLFRFNNADNSVIENLSIKWNTSYSDSRRAFYLNSSENVYINSISIEDFYGGVTSVESYNTVIHNLSTLNVSYGISLSDSQYAMLRDCNLSEAVRGLSVGGFIKNHYNHDIDTSNIINGEPVRYLKNIDGQVLSGLEYQRLYIFDSEDVTISNSNFRNGDGLHMYFCQEFLIRNVTLENSTWGLRLWSSKGTVENCSFDNISSSGIYTYYHTKGYRSLWILNSTIKNTGPAVDLGQADVFIMNTSIMNSTYGVKSFFGTLVNVTFENCTRALRGYNPGEAYILNSTFLNCTYDASFERAHDLHFINSTFNESRIEMDDEVNITVSWYVDIYVEDQFGQPVDGFSVSIYNSTGALEHTMETDKTYMKSVEVMEKRFNLTKVQQFNPHNITVSKGLSKAFVQPEPDVTAYEVFTLTLYDSDPPDTHDDYDGEWHTSAFTVNLTAHDNLTSVNNTYYKLNDGEIKSVSIDGMPHINVSGLNKLEYWSWDVVGNEELHHLVTDIKLDLSPPATQDNLTSYWYNSTIFINLGASDEHSGVNDTFYRINGGSVESVKVSGNPVVSTESINNTLEYWSVDNAGNEEPHNRREEIKLDITPPTTQDNILPDWYRSDIVVNLEADDALSGVNNTYYRVNKGVTRSLKYSGNPVITNEGYGNSVEYWSVDNAGNREVHKTVTDIKLDKTPPVPSFTANRTLLPVNATVLFNATGSHDSLAGTDLILQWDFDEDGIYDVTGEIITEHRFTATGMFNVTLNATDWAGNWNTTYLAIIVESDIDGDGIPDTDDIDDDGDGVADIQDAFPSDPHESWDTDGDGIGDNADLDDDEDGHLDDEDDYPLDPTRWKKTEPAGFDMIWLLPVLLGAVVLVMLFFILRQRGRKPKDIPEEGSQGEQTDEESNDDNESSKPQKPNSDIEDKVEE